MTSRRCIVITSEVFSANLPEQPLPAVQAVAKFLNAELISPEYNHGTTRRSTWAKWIGFQDVPYHFNASSKERILRAAANEDWILFSDINCAIMGLQFAGRSQKLGATSIVLSPMDGTLSLINKLQPFRHQIGKLVTFSPHQHLYAVERLRFPEKAVEMIPPSVDAQYFMSGSTERDSDMVCFVSARKRTLALGTSGKMNWLPDTLDPQAAREAFLRAGVVVLLAEQKQQATCMMPLMWASACAAPLVAPRTFTLQHLLEDSQDGLLYEPGNYDQAVNKVHQILADGELTTRLSSNARKRIANLCTNQHLAGRISAIFRNLDSKSSTPAFYLIPNHMASLL